MRTAVPPLPASAVWFKNHGMDWDELYGERFEPPRKPELTSATDTSCFDEPVEDASFLDETKYKPQPGAWDALF